MNRLAINGGIPVRNTKIGYGCQWIDEDDIEAVVDVLRSNFLTCGPKINELETALSEYTGAKYSVVVNSGTSALHCACIAAGIGPGDEVITTPLTFAASANCILYCGAIPVFADVDINTYNISPESIETYITDKTKAIIAVDFTGQAVDFDAIKKICDKYGLIFIEDAAHSIGTAYKGKKVGSLADMTCFSFHPVKTITGGEGGAIQTNSEKYYKKLVLAHAHGITRSIEEMSESAPEGPWYYEQIMLGYNYRMTDIQAGLLISQLSKLDKFKQRRQEIVRYYNEAFNNMQEIIVQNEIPESDTCRHLYIIRLNFDRLKCTRREFFDALNAENVGCQIHYIPTYWFPYYANLGYEKGICPNAESIYKSVISIPLYPKMTNEDVESVIKAVKKIVDYYRR